MKPRPAFTLIELLVVISIIALLIAILLPALATARKSGQAIACGSNLKQISLAFSMYADEHDDWLPIAKGRNAEDVTEQRLWWHAALQPYLLNRSRDDAHRGGNQLHMYRCPSNPIPESAHRLSYGMNGFVAAVNPMPGPGRAAQIKRDSIRNPGYHHLASDYGANDPNIRNHHALYRDFPALWHLDTDNVLFLDMHVERVPIWGLEFYLEKAPS